MSVRGRSIRRWRRRSARWFRHGTHCETGQSLGNRAGSQLVDRNQRDLPTSVAPGPPCALWSVDVVGIVTVCATQYAAQPTARLATRARPPFGGPPARPQIPGPRPAHTSAPSNGRPRIHSFEGGGFPRRLLLARVCRPLLCSAHKFGLLEQEASRKSGARLRNRPPASGRRLVGSARVGTRRPRGGSAEHPTTSHYIFFATQNSPLRGRRLRSLLGQATTSLGRRLSWTRI